MALRNSCMLPAMTMCSLVANCYCWPKIANFFRILGHNIVMAIAKHYILLFSSDLPYILLETSSTLSDSTKERIEGLFNQLTEEKYEIEATNVSSIKKADLETELDRSFVNQLIALGKFVLGTDCVLVFKIYLSPFSFILTYIYVVITQIFCNTYWLK